MKKRRKRKPKKGICYLCGAVLEGMVNKDHIPPRQMFPSQARKANLSKLYTRPTHESCNQSYQEDENYFTDWMAAMSDTRHLNMDPKVDLRRRQEAAENERTPKRKFFIEMEEAARIYGKHRKWVYDQVDRYGITTKKPDTCNKVLLQLTDLIAHRGEPPSNGTPATVENHTPESQILTVESTDTALLRQENWFLTQRIEELEADRAERQSRESRWEEERARLEGIIERHTYALPPAEPRGVLYRLVQRCPAK